MESCCHHTALCLKLAKTKGKSRMDTQIPNTHFAHRGLHNHEYPENSLPAFELAMQKGYGIELDVHLLASGEVVVFHDDTTLRMTGIDRKISSLTKDELSSFFLGGTPFHIPLLREVLEVINGNVPILLEIKNEGKVGALEQVLIHELQSYTGVVLIQAFHPFVLRYFKRHAPHLLRGQLASHFEDQPNMKRYKKFLLKNLYLNFVSKPHFISYDVKHLNGKRLKRIKLPIFAWTIINQIEANQALKVASHLIFEQFEPIKK